MNILSATLPASSEASDQSRLAAATRAQANTKKIDEKAKDFEAVFIHQMLEHMFEGVSTEGEFGGGQSEEIYRSFMLDEYSKVIVKSGGIGVADHVKREMLSLQEKGA